MVNKASLYEEPSEIVEKKIRAPGFPIKGTVGLETLIAQLKERSGQPKFKRTEERPVVEDNISNYRAKEAISKPYSYINWN